MLQVIESIQDMMLLLINTHVYIKRVDV